MIRAVLFDLDDTLFAHRGAVEAGILAHLDAIGTVVEDRAATLEQWRDLEELHYPRYLAGELGYLEQRRVRARGLMSALGGSLDGDARADDWWSGYHREYRNAWRLHDDALPCLDTLRDRIPGVKLGIITNGELDFQMTRLDATRLGERMDVIVASGDVGVTKPDRRIFELACERLGSLPSDAVYVGDRLRTDAIGAAAAGLRGIWLDRPGEESDPADLREAEDLGVVRIRSLAELPVVVAAP
ncbi:hydrolase [Naasia aerilata]|uniref:Hydrolase n=1 Tax=Naasia aerilata TaxID=1162966 RepID=A0ABM8GC69_9MICO|nr:hydrolase [Naasia aerilata]